LTNEEEYGIFKVQEAKSKPKEQNKTTKIKNERKQG